MWRKYTGPFMGGLLIDGDKTVSPTRWWNHWWVAWWSWKTAVMLEPAIERPPHKPLRVGFINAWGEVKICDRLLVGRFHVLIGHEPCTFFAIDEKNNEVPLAFIARKTRDDVVPEDGPRL